MKKIVSIALALILTLFLAACTVPKTDTDDINDASDTKVSSVNNDEKNNIAKESDNSLEWKTFLKEYEGWVDKYIEITKKYKENSLDMSLLSDYTEMMAELAEWSTKAEDMQKEIEKASPSELAQYSAELARIAAKIARAVY